MSNINYMPLKALIFQFRFPELKEAVLEPAIQRIYVLINRSRFYLLSTSKILNKIDIKCFYISEYLGNGAMKYKNV